MPDFSRRSIILGTAGVAAAGAGVTAAAGGLQGSVEGQADVQAEQALTVTDVSVVNSGSSGSSDVDASFTRTSDDNTEFQAAVELNNGDLAAFAASIENSAADNLDVQVTVDSPDAIDVDVVNTVENRISSATPEDLDPDGSNKNDSAVQTGEGTYIAEIGGTGTQDIGIIAELDDTADPGSYDIGAAINPLSTDS